MGQDLLGFVAFGNHYPVTQLLTAKDTLRYVATQSSVPLLKPMGVFWSKQKASFLVNNFFLLETAVSKVQYARIAHASQRH
eukprot:scaffold5157_cov100-Cylindrotheca_fusiformis.AAC.6